MIWEAALFGLSVLLFIWGAYLFLGYRKEKKEVKKKYTEWFQEEGTRSSFISALGDRFDQTETGTQLRDKLLRSNVSLLPSEFMAILLLIGFASGIFMYSVFSLSFLVSLAVSSIIVTGSYWMFFTVRKNKYVDRMSDQLSDVCRLMANSTRAGLTVNQAIEVVASETPNPAGNEFKKMAQNLRLGVDMERALIQLERNVPTKEFKLFIATILIQRKSGGNLSAVLDEMSKTLDERKIIRQTIKTMTAEQRFVSYILPALPILMILMMNMVMEGFIEPLFTIPGAILFVLFAIGMLIAFLLVRSVTNIRV
ncbi:type II secretion system F family protein [Sutcliffiella cohnii]|uniref:type II secretion system F family protein n=1 Tax=Sutcliffiella cohnii TaxID=33932 RepID=UPI002E22B884|nr:type II secretion system F family protein [Sutcliffiella cohnii]